MIIFEKIIALKRLILFSILFASITFISCNDNATPVNAKADSAGKTAGEYGKLTNLQSSNNIADVICQGWELEDDLEALNDGDAEGMIPFRSYYLSPDFTFVKNPRNAIEFGKWEFNQETKTIYLTYNSGSKDTYKIAALAAKELKLVNIGINSQTILKFVSDGTVHKDITDNPYHISNNGWRIKPKKAEPDSLLRKHLKDFLHFHILFYRDNLAREMKTISFYGFPTCLKWYAGGIFMIKKEELPNNWINCFYNKEQALKAYGMMSALMDKKYKWSKENISWVKKNLDVLEQMYSKL